MVALEFHTERFTAQNTASIYIDTLRRITQRATEGSNVRQESTIKLERSIFRLFSCRTFSTAMLHRYSVGNEAR
jgi:hypothetical protein